MNSMELKVLQLSDLAAELDLTESITEPGVWYSMREKPATLAVNDHGMAALCIACTDDAIILDQIASMVDFHNSVLYAQGEVNGKPYLPILN